MARCVDRPAWNVGVDGGDRGGDLRPCAHDRFTQVGTVRYSYASLDWVTTRTVKGTSTGFGQKEQQGPEGPDKDYPFTRNRTAYGAERGLHAESLQALPLKDVDNALRIGRVRG